MRLVFSRELQQLDEPFSPGSNRHFWAGNAVFKRDNKLRITDGFGLELLERPRSRHWINPGTWREVFDHCTHWRRKDAAVAVTAHPYVKQGQPESIDPWLGRVQKALPKLQVRRVPVTSWYYPEACAVIVACAPEVEIVVEELAA